MFTGIVEEVGTVRARGPATLEIAATTVLEETRLGDSIAVNGVCLTAAALDDGWFRADLMPETMRRSNLGKLDPGDPVNLERPLQPTGRMGGHIVQGHVDGTATVCALQPEDDALMVTLSAAPDLLRYVVSKGFIALDGASLTVVDRTDATFRVSLVRYTLDHTIFAQWHTGSRVNVELDVLAKYVEQLLALTPTPLSRGEGQG